MLLAAFAITIHIGPDAGGLRNILLGWWTIPDGITWGLGEIFGTAGWYAHPNPYLAVAVGWLAYLGLSTCCLMTRRKSIYFPAFGALCVLFLLTVYGCYAAAHFSM